MLNVSTAGNIVDSTAQCVVIYRLALYTYGVFLSLGSSYIFQHTHQLYCETVQNVRIKLYIDAGIEDCVILLTEK